jgi:hypothetical protein
LANSQLLRLSLDGNVKLKILVNGTIQIQNGDFTLVTANSAIISNLEANTSNIGTLDANTIITNFMNVTTLNVTTINTTQSANLTLTGNGTFGNLNVTSGGFITGNTIRAAQQISFVYAVPGSLGALSNSNIIPWMITTANITSVFYRLGSGTLNLKILKNAVAVTNLSVLAATTTGKINVATGGNNLAVGDRLRLEFTTPGSETDLEIVINMTAP